MNQSTDRTEWLDEMVPPVGDTEGLANLPASEAWADEDHRRAVIRTDVDAAAYHGNDRVSSGHARAALKSIADLREKLDGDGEESAALRRGRAIHGLLLEPDRVVVDTCPDGVVDDENFDALKAAIDGIEDPETGKPASKGGGKAGVLERLRRLRPDTVFLSDVRRQWEDEGLIVLSEREYDIVQQATKAVRANPDALALLMGEGVGTELTVEWAEVVDVDGVTVEIECQARIDAVHGWADRDEYRPLVIDLKTLGDAPTWPNARRAIWRHMLDVQMAWNIYALQQAGVDVETELDLGQGENADGEPITVGALFVFVSTTAPFVCEIVPLSTETLNAAMRGVRVAIERIARERAQPDVWPGYTSRPGDATRPGIHDPITINRPW